MTKELKQKLERKNQIVKFFQEGKLSEAEFNEAIKTENLIERLESKDMSITENDLFESWKENGDAPY